MRVALLVGVFAAVTISAAPIADLFNTGTSAPGSADSHWTVNGATAFVTDQSVYPFPAWPLNPLANWISPHANYDGPTDAGDTTFIFATTFTLPSNFLTAAIVMRLAADNGIEDVKLNGTSLALTTAMRLLPGNTATRAVIAEARGFQDGLGAPISFNHTHGIVAGLNTLEFHVRNSRTDDMNQQNPTGLLAAFESDFSVPPGTSELPEPSTMGLMGAGLGTVIFLVRRRKAGRRSAIAA